MSNNTVKDWAEFNKLADLPCLLELLFVGMVIYFYECVNCIKYFRI